MELDIEVNDAVHEPRARTARDNLRDESEKTKSVAETLISFNSFTRWRAC